MQDTQRLDFMVRRDNLAEVQFGDEPQTQAEQPLEPGDALLRVERYAFTANNITYGLLGAVMGYWEFFPAPAGWGRIPVWGYANVVASRAPGLQEGERVYGYLPMSPLLRVRPEHATDQAFIDASAHRSPLPAVYQRYARLPHTADLASEDIRAVLKPLTATGFLLDDWLAEQDMFGARQLVVASASSKTALATAFALSRRTQRSFEVIGLTSARNRDFCQRVGYYDRIGTYDELATLPAVPTTFIDMAGDLAVRQAVHTHFGSMLRYSCMVGMTHGSISTLGAASDALPGPAPQLFFAPDHIAKRQKLWGPVELAGRVSEAEQAFFTSARSWLEIIRASGETAIEVAYRAVLAGNTQPNQGYVLSL